MSIEEMKARIAQANKSVNELNTQSTRNQSAKEVLTKQFDELCAEYKTKYGVELTVANLEVEKANVLKEKEEEVAIIEKAISLINEGNINGAKRVLGMETAEQNAPVAEPSPMEVVEPTTVHSTQSVIPESEVSNIIPPVINPVPEPVVEPSVVAQVPNQFASNPVPPVATPVQQEPSQVIPPLVSNQAEVVPSPQVATPPSQPSAVAPPPGLSGVSDIVNPPVSPQQVKATSFASIIGGTAFEPGKL